MNKRIDEIKKRTSAATPGPWGAGGIRKNLIQTANAPFFEVCTVRGGSSFRDIDGQQKANAAFIAHAREDIPYLLGEIERLQALTEAGESAIDTNKQLLRKIKLFGNALKSALKALTESQRREAAAVEDMGEYIRMPSSCEICNKAWSSGGLCDKTADGCVEHGGFEWRGPQEGE